MTGSSVPVCWAHALEDKTTINAALNGDKRGAEAPIF
jgi:hypothetical protein